MIKHMLALCLAGFVMSAAAEVGGDCTWRDPGHDPYTGGTARALMSFGHIGGANRLAMLGKIKLGQPDDVVRIRRDSITGSPALVYDASINDMHFGKGRTCGTVTREGWADDHAEIADVYRTGRWCGIRPRVCGNWFWTVCDLRSGAAIAPVSGAARAAPEPGALWLVLAALAAMVIARRISPSGRG